MIDTNDIRSQGRFLYGHAENVAVLVQGLRDGDLTLDGTALRTAMAGARNIAETFLRSLDTAEAECKGHLTERCRPLFASLPPLARPLPGIPTGYADTVSPAGAA